MLNFSAVSAFSAVIALFQLLLDQLGDFEFAGDFCLAKAATGHFDSVLLHLSGANIFIKVIGAFILIMTFGGDGARRAASCAGFARLIKIVETVGIMMGIFPR